MLDGGISNQTGRSPQRVVLVETNLGILDAGIVSTYQVNIEGDEQTFDAQALSSTVRNDAVSGKSCMTKNVAKAAITVSNPSRIKL